LDVDMSLNGSFIIDAVENAQKFYSWTAGHATNNNNNNTNNDK